MADSKYAGLPGIVTDQPDVYETSDLPESEQAYSESESVDSNPAFEVLHISGTESFEKFKGKYVNCTDIDFSDRITKYPRQGYRTNKPLEWNIVGEDEEETLVQKYQRLQCEINNLQQEVQQKEDTIKHGDGVVAVADLSRSVDELHGMLHSLKLEETLGKEIFSAAVEPEHALQTKLINLLEDLKRSGIVSEKKTESPKVPGESLSVGGITYELQYAPEHAKLTQMARASHLESKLDKLEALIGNNQDKLSSLSAWTNHRSLLGAVEILSSRLALLEPTHLDHVEGRLHAVHTRMNAISEKKTAVEDANKQSKVSELYDLMKKCEVLTAALPEIVDRLSSVENLHQEATQFSRSLKQLNAAQTELEAKLEGNATLMTAAQEKFLGNLTTIQSSMKALDERIQKLQQKQK
ncbi:Dynactin subunit 2 [Armadillidium vulgare]|nr:Dynactin subunit 2 [Armadillidium vulgare]